MMPFENKSQISINNNKFICTSYRIVNTKGSDLFDCPKGGSGGKPTCAFITAWPK